MKKRTILKMWKNSFWWPIKTPYIKHTFCRMHLIASMHRLWQLRKKMTFHQNPGPIYHLLPNVWNTLYTTSASIIVNIPYWPPYSTIISSLLLYRVSPQWFFHFGEVILIAWTHSGWVRWMVPKRIQIVITWHSVHVSFYSKCWVNLTVRFIKI